MRRGSTDGFWQRGLFEEAIWRMWCHQGLTAKVTDSMAVDPVDVVVWRTDPHAFPVLMDAHFLAWRQGCNRFFWESFVFVSFSTECETVKGKSNHPRLSGWIFTFFCCQVENQPCVWCGGACGVSEMLLTLPVPHIGGCRWCLSDMQALQHWQRQSLRTLWLCIEWEAGCIPHLLLSSLWGEFPSEKVWSDGKDALWIYHFIIIYGYLISPYKHSKIVLVHVSFYICSYTHMSCKSIHT